jgi:hypothetical protein
MGKVYMESGLNFDFRLAKDVKKADSPSVQGLSAVDFIVETESEFIFIEVKNPDNPHAQDRQRKEYLGELGLETYPLKMAMKFKDTLLKEVITGKSFDKPIKYLILLQFSMFDTNHRIMLLNKIREHIPLFKESTYKAVESIAFLGIMTVDEFCEKYPCFSCNIL